MRFSASPCASSLPEPSRAVTLAVKSASESPALSPNGPITWLVPVSVALLPSAPPERPHSTRQDAATAGQLTFISSKTPIHETVTSIDDLGSARLGSARLGSARLGK